MAQLNDFSKIIHNGNEIGKVLHQGKTIWGGELGTWTFNWSGFVDSQISVYDMGEYEGITANVTIRKSPWSKYTSAPMVPTLFGIRFNPKSEVENFNNVLVPKELSMTYYSMFYFTNLEITIIPI